jgi:hypothetical protein
MDWRAVAAIILAAGAAVTLVLLALQEVLTSARPVTEISATLLATLGGAAIGSVATYLGSRRNGKD